MTVYVSANVRGQVDAAQTRLNLHALTLNGSLCTACGVEGPCAERRAALKTLATYGRLPHRQPGASRPDRMSMRSTGGLGWFG
jgi:hypothetical protein